jgi:AraC-like DNA-binding protein
VDEKKLRAAFQKLPRMKSEELLNIGRLADLALKGFIASAGPELFEYEIRLSRYPAIRRALEIIQDSEDFEKIDQTWIAGKVFLNPSYFCRLFKEALGCTFSDFLIKRKVDVASSLLHVTDLSVMEIAIRCGYSRQSYFTCMFKRYTGMTPSQYRNNRKKKN